MSTGTLLTAGAGGSKSCACSILRDEHSYYCRRQHGGISHHDAFEAWSQSVALSISCSANSLGFNCATDNLAAAGGAGVHRVSVAIYWWKQWFLHTVLLLQVQLLLRIAVERGSQL